MLIAVTGAAGFIGGHVTAAFVHRGDDVVGIDRRPMPATAALGAPAARRAAPQAPGGWGRLRWLRADLSRPDGRVAAVLGDADAVVHLAGRPGVRGAGAALATARWRDNVLAGRRVLDKTPLHIPVVVASSSSVYGGARPTPGGPRPSDEDDRLRPRGGYARSKVRLEQRCAERAERGGRVAVLRPFTVIGPHQRPDMAVARWVRALRTGEPLTVLGDLQATRDLTDVADVVRAVLAAVDRRVTGTANVGTGTAHTLADIVAALELATGRTARLRFIPADAAEPRHTLAATARCRALLGFAPRTDLRAVVARICGPRQAVAAAPRT